MRRLTLIVISLAVIYAGYWFVGSSRATAAVQNAVIQMQETGWQADVDVTTRGFPSRFDTTLRDISLRAPDGSWGYDAPFIQSLALSYRPNNVIVVFPETQQIITPAETLTLESPRLRAAAMVKANLALSFDNLTLEGEDIALRSDLGWTATLETLLAAARLQPESATTYDTYAKLDQFTLPENAGVIETAILDGSVRLQQPLDRATQDILVAQVVVNALRVDWNDVILAGEGQLDVDANGLPEGQIMLQIENWTAIVPRLVSIGVLDAEFADTALKMGALLAGGKDTVSLPFKFTDGSMSIGPLPLGPAPNLHFIRQIAP